MFDFFSGDWLTFDRTKKALSGAADGKTPEARLNSLVPVMADFHTQMEVLQIAWKLYSKDSSADVGTLFSCRNMIDANTRPKAKEDYHNNGEFLDKVTHAYVLTGKKSSHEGYHLRVVIAI